MADGVALFIFNSLYEPQEENGLWVVHYKWQGEWKKEPCDTREAAVKAHKQKENLLRGYYNQFLKEIKVKK